MHKIERHAAIMRMLGENGILVVSDACELLRCSDQTIRRDLQELEDQGGTERAGPAADLRIQRAAGDLQVGERNISSDRGQSRDPVPRASCERRQDPCL